jgi:hypothetical protein
MTSYNAGTCRHNTYGGSKIIKFRYKNGLAAGKHRGGSNKQQNGSTPYLVSVSNIMICRISKHLF